MTRLDDGGACGGLSPLIIGNVLGRVCEQPWHDQAHRAAEMGQLETVRISPPDAARRRMRVATDTGRDVALALPRDAVLVDGSVLYIAPGLMIVVRIDQGPRLRLVPADAVSALRLGYFCGNLHWKADFQDGAIEIHMDGPEETFQARLADAARLCEFSIQLRGVDE